MSAADGARGYVVLLRGINVGGKNRVPMAELRRLLLEDGFEQVTTYINSGNVLLRSALDAATIAARVETLLHERFELDSPLIRALVLTDEQLAAVVADKPAGFGERPDEYHSDAIFLIDLDAEQALSVFSPRDGVDRVWAGNGVIYSQRVSALRTRSRLGKIAGTPEYKAMTIRNWNTTTKLLALTRERQPR
jgi:uncharacterized protein (DUF1697 family)